MAWGRILLCFNVDHYGQMKALVTYIISNREFHGYDALCVWLQSLKSFPAPAQLLFTYSLELFQEVILLSIGLPKFFPYNTLNNLLPLMVFLNL